MSCSMLAAVRKRDAWSSAGRLLWMLVLSVSVMTVLEYLCISDGTSSFSHTDSIWNFRVSGSLNTETVKHISAEIEHNGGHALTVAMGNFSKVSSDKRTFIYDSQDRVPICSSVKPGTFLVPEYELDEIESYQISAIKEEGDFPWFGTGSMIDGNLEVGTSNVVVDAALADYFEVGVGDCIEVEAVIGNHVNSKRETVKETLTITAVVLPSVAFRGICACLPSFTRALAKRGDCVASEIYAYGLSDECALRVAKRIALDADGMFDIEMGGEAAGDVSDSEALVPLPLAHLFVVFLLAAFVAVTCFDALMVRKGLLSISGQEGVAVHSCACLLETCLIWIASIGISYAIIRLFVLTKSFYYPWVFAGGAWKVFVAGGLGVLACLVCVRSIALRKTGAES